jgi:Dullard-like phosphatase family protein
MKGFGLFPEFTLACRLRRRVKASGSKCQMRPRVNSATKNLLMVVLWWAAVLGHVFAAPMLEGDVFEGDGSGFKPLKRTQQVVAEEDANEETDPWPYPFKKSEHVEFKKNDQTTQFMHDEAEVLFPYDAEDDEGLRFKSLQRHVHVEVTSLKMPGPVATDGEESMMSLETFYIRRLPPLQTVLNKNAPKLLPPQKLNKITLVVDLDETLVRCVEQEISSYDFQFSMRGVTLSCIYRPDYLTFRQKASEMFEVVIWSAGNDEYVQKVVSFLDPQMQYIDYVLAQSACAEVDSLRIKVLDRLGRELAQVVALDNSYLAFAYNLDNLIPIESFYGNKGDNELVKILDVLKGLSFSRDVQPYLIDQYDLTKRILGTRSSSLFRD